jgi:alkylated DNA repair dioxygenase AlkB
MSRHERREYARILAAPTDAELWLRARAAKLYPGAALGTLDLSDGVRFTRLSPRPPGKLPPGVTYEPNFLGRQARKALISFSRENRSWGKKEKEGRETLLYGDYDVRYTYALNINAVPEPWPQLLAALKQQVEKHVRPARPYNVCLGNAYADGKQQFRFHADHEERGNNVPIAVVTVGAPRWFQFRRSDSRSRELDTQIVLESGSLLIMDSRVHDTHRHGLPPDRRITYPRYSYTFRSARPPKVTATAAAV